MEDQETVQGPDAELTISPQQAQFYQFARSQPAKHLYILFNSANHPQLPQQYYALEPQQHYFGLLQDILQGYNEQSIPVMPYVVAINPGNIEHNPFIHWLFSTAESQSSFFVFGSDHDLATVAGHWDSLSLVYNRHQQRVIMRLFDGRISKRFLPQLPIAEQAQLLGPCQWLWFANDPDEPVIINNTDVQLHQRPAPWFYLSPEHEALLCANDHRALKYNLSLYLWEHHSQALAQYSHEQLEQLIDLGLGKAQKLGFSLTSTICQCVALCFDYSPVFYRHPAIQTLWQQAASEYQHLLALGEKVTPAQWQQIITTVSMDDWLDMPDQTIAMYD